jgi:glycosyltransferase involved in cell wall biosynthesis
VGAPRLAVISVLAEENMASMDLVSEMLLRELTAMPNAPVRASEVRPEMVRRLTRGRALRRRSRAFRTDRLVSRLFDVPQQLRRVTGSFDAFHLSDHSYAHALHSLPAERTGVFCHDLDAFRAYGGARWWWKPVGTRLISGLQQAALVFHTTDAVRGQIEQHGLVDPDRLVRAPYGIAPEFRLRHPGDALPDAPCLEGPFLLHVGTCFERKRIDVLLRVHARLRERNKKLRLLQIGGLWTHAQRELIDRLGIDSSVVQLPRQQRRVVADHYRRASLVLMPSEAEGFGLPVVEALACGSRVIASDIPVLREVGGEAVVYCPLAEVDTWVEAAHRLIEGPDTGPELSVRLAQARRYSWETHANTIGAAYKRLIEEGAGASSAAA